MRLGPKTITPAVQCSSAGKVWGSVSSHLLSGLSATVGTFQARRSSALKVSLVYMYGDSTASRSDCLLVA